MLSMNFFPKPLPKLNLCRIYIFLSHIHAQPMWAGLQTPRPRLSWGFLPILSTTTETDVRVRNNSMAISKYRRWLRIDQLAMKPHAM